MSRWRVAVVVRCDMIREEAASAAASGSNAAARCFFVVEGRRSSKRLKIVKIAQEKGL
jgi:hypothetical protein